MIRWALTLAALALGHGALACSPLPPDTRSSVEIIRASKPIVVQPNCAFNLGGVYDTFSGGAAQDLGAGRVMQALFGGESTILLADCRTREATMLYAPPDPTEDPVSTCGPSQFLPLTGAGAIIDLTDGPDLTALTRIAEARGVRDGDPIAILNTAPWGKPSPRKDRIDLLCGCKLHYPDSPGAR